jgi:hypothetical protein
VDKVDGVDEAIEADEGWGREDVESEGFMVVLDAVLDDGRHELKMRHITSWRAKRRKKGIIYT